MFKPEDEKLAHSIQRAANRLDCGRTTIYGLIRNGQLQAVKLGSRTLVLESSLQRLLSKLHPVRCSRHVPRTRRPCR
jgi:excisionase family DNA binding protein